MTLATTHRRARYLQSQLRDLRMRSEFGIPNLEPHIEATLGLLFVEEQKLAEIGLYLTRDGDVVDLPVLA